MIYRDFFEFVTPGTALVQFLPVQAFRASALDSQPTGPAPGAWAGLAWCGDIAEKLMRPGLASAAERDFPGFGARISIDPAHHWYSVLTAIAAIAALMERRTPARIAAAGFLCGLSACFTQTRGLAVAVGFTVFLWWESRQRQEGWRKLFKKEAWLVTSFLATFMAVNAYFIWKAGPARFFWCTVVFVLKYYPKEAHCEHIPGFYGRSFPYFVPAHIPLFVRSWLLLFAVTPFIFILFFARYWRESSRKPVGVLGAPDAGGNRRSLYVLEHRPRAGRCSDGGQ